MSNVKPLNINCITPELVIESITNGPKLKAVYIVAFEEDGTPSVYASGDLGQICHAAILLNDYATSAARGEFDEFDG